MTCEFCDNDGTNLVCDGGIAVCDDCWEDAEFYAIQEATKALDEAVAEQTLQTAAVWEAEGGDGEFPW